MEAAILASDGRALDGFGKRRFLRARIVAGTAKSEDQISGTAGSANEEALASDQL
jgi:hypothetical protein